MPHLITRRAFATALGAFAALTTLPLQIRFGVAGALKHINADASGLALYGYDPVAYFTDSKPTVGDAAITATHDGVTYCFASAQNRDLFVKEPGRYLPAYGGFCAYGVSQNYKVKIDPNVWKIVDGRLFLNYDASVGELWSKDIPGYISKAEAIWPTLSQQ